MKKDKNLNLFATSSIAKRIVSVDPSLVDLKELSSLPEDPQEFLEEMWKDLEVCTRCVLSETRTLVVKPDGTADADIMVVGEGPGFLEDRCGVPLVAPLELRGSRCAQCKFPIRCFGHRILQNPRDFNRKKRELPCTYTPSNTQLLSEDFYIKSAGTIFDGILLHKWGGKFPRHNWVEQYNKSHPTSPAKVKSPWYITNTLHCRSYDPVKLQDTTPESVPVERCRRWLVFQWAAVNPKVIIAFGRTALSIFAPGSKADPGSLLETPFGPVLFQYHPAHYMRDDSLKTKNLGYAKVAKTMEQSLQIAGYL